MLACSLPTLPAVFEHIYHSTVQLDQPLIYYSQWRVLSEMIYPTLTQVTPTLFIAVLMVPASHWSILLQLQVVPRAYFGTQLALALVLQFVKNTRGSSQNGHIYSFCSLSLYHTSSPGLQPRSKTRMICMVHKTEDVVWICRARSRCIHPTLNLILEMET